jgi:PAS domain S-box-containing protein
MSPLKRHWHQFVHRSPKDGCVSCLDRTAAELGAEGDQQTHQRLVEKALREAKDHLEAIINAIGEPVFVKDARHRYVLVNDAYCRWLGRARRQILGQTSADFYGQEQAEAFLLQDQRVLESGREDLSEMQVSDSSGEHRTLSVFKTLHVEASGERLIVGSFRDVTAQKALEQHLRDADQLKSDMISLVSHEYGNQLTNMKLALHLLRESEPAPQGESRKHAFEVLTRAIEHLRVSTENFLSLNRLESGKFSLHLRPTSIRSAALETLVLLRPMAEAKRIRLSLQSELPGERPVPVRADAEALSLIMNNLVNNAIKYTPEGGVVTLRTSVLPAATPQVRFCVEDTGIGISAPDQQHILSGFFRTSEGRKVATGYGVGLMLVKELLERHGSRLQIDSAPGKGSRFSFDLPLWTDA